MSVSELVQGLQAGAAYHYRVVASNAEGSVYGQDRVLKTYPSPSSAPDSCPNAVIRGAQFSSYLPDCRAYELVSPTYKKGANIAADGDTAQSAVSGNAIKYYSTSAFGDAVGISTRGAEYVSQRGEDGWTTHSINPEQGSIALSTFAPAEYQALSPDLSKGVYYARTPVLPGYPNVEHVSNLYLRTDALSAPPGSYELLSDSATSLPQELPSLGQFISFAGASADWKHIVFESVNNLTPDAPPQPEACTKERTTAFFGECQPRVYEWFNGSVRLVGVLPNGEVAAASIAGAGAGATESQDKGTFTQEAVSSDGSRVVFETGPLREQSRAFGGGSTEGSGLYMRIDGRETIKLNASERSEPDPNGPQPVRFQTATADDSKVFFTSAEALTEDAVPGAMKIYMYDVNAPTGKRLTLISVDSEPGVKMSDNGVTVDGISSNGEYVYFETEALLTPDQPPFPSDNGNWKRVLFVWHNGALRYITTHDFITYPDGGDSWNGEDSGKSVPPSFRVSSDGKTIAFGSQDSVTAEQTGYDNSHNTGPNSLNVRHNSEVYVYNYDTEKLMCASCNPSGAMPGSMAAFIASGYIDGLAAYTLTELEYTNYKTHALSDDGRYLFFDTGDALLPQDTNGRRDVYEYDTRTGQLRLISGGSCDCVSTFVDASPDGSNAFFVTSQSLVRADGDTNGDLYDARIDGGIASQNVAPPAPCEGDDCQGPAKAVPTFSLPSSSTFAGAGNPPPVAAKPRAKAKRKGSKTKRRRRKHKRKRRAGTAGASSNHPSRPTAR